MIPENNLPSLAGDLLRIHRAITRGLTLTRKCLEILAQKDWPVVVQTRSLLVLRDLDILKEAKYFEAGLSIDPVS